MTTSNVNANITHIRIGNTDIFIEDINDNAGKITISDTEYDYNFSKFWGSMGSNIFSFLMQINDQYFASKLISHGESEELDVASTIKALKDNIEKDVFIGILRGHTYTKFKDFINNKLDQVANEGYRASEVELYDLLYDFENDLGYYIEEDLSCIKDLKLELTEYFTGISNFVDYQVYKATPKYEWLLKLLPALKNEILIINN